MTVTRNIKGVLMIVKDLIEIALIKKSLRVLDMFYSYLRASAGERLAARDAG